MIIRRKITMDKVIEKVNEIIADLNDINEEGEFSEHEKNKFRVWAVLGYFLPILFFVPIVLDGNSKFCKFHANQQLVWLVICIILGIAASIIRIIPILGDIIGAVIGLCIIAADLVLAYAAGNGKAVRIPMLGNIKIF